MKTKTMKLQEFSDRFGCYLIIPFENTSKVYATRSLPVFINKGSYREWQIESNEVFDVTPFIDPEEQKAHNPTIRITPQVTLQEYANEHNCYVGVDRGGNVVRYGKKPTWNGNGWEEAKDDDTWKYIAPYIQKSERMNHAGELILPERKVDE